jgi:transcriptional regulator with GAF, ATPase, and Fis domain
MLIRYLETKYPEAAGRVDYHKIIGATESIQNISDPHEFLLDPNNWIPFAVLRELMTQCEEASGEKDFAYHAALAHYETARSRAPTLLETIAMLVSDAESVLHSAAEWASGYTNYLQLQAFKRPQESDTLYMLSRFSAPLDIQLSNTRFVQGNLEGIAKLDEQLETFSCEETYSQVRLMNLVVAFGDHYQVSQNAPLVTVTHRSTGKVVLTARQIPLASEWVPWQDPSLPGSALRQDQMVACPDSKGGITVYVVKPEVTAGQREPQKEPPGATALQVERGGTFSKGPLSLTIHDGAIFDAPYTQYRMRWRKRPTPPMQTADEKTLPLMGDRQRFAHLLFDHLKNLQSAHRRTLGMVIKNIELVQENIQLKQELSAQQETGGILGKSQAIQNLLSLLSTIAASDTTVLITGETGTGKELAARLIHKLSRRRDHRFVAVNCGALPETLLESELFGHERGSFTGAVAQKKGKFEVAQRGTLFLDEIGDVSPAVQVKLLRVLQEKEFQRVGGNVDLKADVRLIAATNRDLIALMEQNQFRHDLFYRLNVIQLYMPALRERTEDIPELAQHFIGRFAERACKSISGLNPDALRLCLAYKWPGNVRELENAMERAVTLAPEGKKWITPDLLPASLQTAAEPVLSHDVTDFVDRLAWDALQQTLQNSGSLTALLNQLEWIITRRAVAEYGGNKSRAAKVLGRTYRWLRKLESTMTESSPPTSPPD